jgi:WD40 repeat protein
VASQPTPITTSAVITAPDSSPTPASSQLTGSFLALKLKNTIQIPLSSGLTGRVEANIELVKFNPNNKTFVAIINNNDFRTLRVWDLNSFKELYNSYILERSSLQFSSDGKFFAYLDKDGIKLREADSGKEIKTIATERANIFLLAISPDNKILATMKTDPQNNLTLWDVASGKELRTIKSSGNFYNVFSFSPDGKTIAIADSQKLVDFKLLETSTGKEIASLANKAPLTKLNFTPDGKYLITSAPTSPSKIWEIATRKEVASFDMAGNSLAISPDSKRVAGISANYKLSQWEIPTGKKIVDLPGLPDYGPGGWLGWKDNFLIYFDPSNIYIWNANQSLVYKSSTKESTDFTSVAISNDGKYLLSGHQLPLTDNYKIPLRIWEFYQPNGPVDEMKAKPVKPGPPENVTAAAGDGQVTITWTPSKYDSGSPVTGYNIYRLENNQPIRLNSAPLTVTTYTDKGLANNVEYFYQVTALNSAGESGLSFWGRAIPRSSKPLPHSPFLLFAVPGSHQIELHWQPEPGRKDVITGYNIYRLDDTIDGKAPGKKPVKIKTVPVNPDPASHDEIYVDTNLIPGVEYSYSVTALNNDGESSPSNSLANKPTP